MTPDQEREFTLVAGILALCDAAQASGLPVERVMLGLGKALGVAMARAIKPGGFDDLTKTLSDYIREQADSYAAFRDRKRGPKQ